MEDEGGKRKKGRKDSNRNVVNLTIIKRIGAPRQQVASNSQLRERGYGCPNGARHENFIEKNL